MPNFISEDNIEQGLLTLLRNEYGYELLNCYTLDANTLNDGSGRSDKREVIFSQRLKIAAQRLNPTIPETALAEALHEVTRSRRAMSLIAANQELDSLIRDGIPITFSNAQGKTEHQRVRLIDFSPTNDNDFLAVSQLWVKGDVYYRRPDVLLYINGLPLVFIELKNSNIKLKNAYDSNLITYKKEIPQLFHATAVCVLSNGLESKVGSVSAGWEHFFNWLRVDNEKEKIDRLQIYESGTSLERIIHGLCRPEILLDYIENFILFHNNQKIIAQNHQFIGVNKAIDVFAQRQQQSDEERGKLGVFWHTQGSGKSFSMIFYARKIWRKMTGNYTFVVVTDRQDLDGQIYRNFLNTNTVSKKEAVRPKDSQEMRAFLSQNKRIVFTLIHKFRYPKGKQYPVLSPREDIIVIVDEAHRTQYETLAQNMRVGLPNAQYLAFTGTPLLGKNRKTNAWFGGYVSEYNFVQSMDDGATVPLFYEKRVPEVLIQNEDLSDEFYEILEDENLDDVQQAKLEKKFARETEVIVRDDRLETIAKDIVQHFPRRGYLGKGLVISVDKFTAVKVYNKVQYHWKEEIKQLHKEIKAATSPGKKAYLQKTLDCMRCTQMAVVISEEADEEAKFAKKGLDIKPHRQRMNNLDKQGHDVEYQFKDPDDPLQLVFVCAMWLTGFDAPTLSTLYLDKPMKNHTLMQTIARANRVTPHLINGVVKTNGEIIDYYNVFRNMKEAFAAYAEGSEGQEEMPVQEKSALFGLLDDALAQGINFCQSKGIDLESLDKSAEVFTNLSQFKEYADTLLSKDDWRKEFTVYENTISALYEACKPEIMQKEQWRPLVFVFQYLRGVLDAIIEQQDIDNVSLRIAELLDESVVTIDDGLQTQKPKTEYQIKQIGKVWDLRQVNLAKLREEFRQKPYKHIEIADLRAFIEDKLQQMLQQNSTRADFAQRLQEIIDRYNAGGMTTENTFEELIKFNQDLTEEEERHIRMGLTEEELELFDLMKKEKMTKTEEVAVKNAAQALLKRLREEKPKVIVQDWYRDGQSQERVKTAVETILDKNLPTSYDRALFKSTCDRVYNTIYERAYQGLAWAS
ncbi:MAG: type I restriction endonuclease subunit R [Chloroflexi bacterium]|nr:type I restriction endonuclease subunit R [Chloroflexota bacterium]